MADSFFTRLPFPLLRTLSTGHSLLNFLIPRVLSVLLLLTGVMMLLSGALPTVPTHSEWLRSIVPLPVVEISHLLSSIIGLAMLFLARAVRLRLDAAWYGVLALLVIGMSVSVLKGLNWQEAIVLGLLFLIFLPTRPYFFRESSLMALPWPPIWIIAITVALLSVAWIGFDAYRGIPYSPELWSDFSYRGDVSRFLRALVVVGVLAMLYVFYRLLGIARPATDTASTEDLEKALPLVQQSPLPGAWLALLGDKKLFWAEDGQAFLSYRISGMYWIVMGDPVGQEESFRPLVRAFRDQAYFYKAKIVFYQVSRQHLPLYLDFGMTLLKIGEEARVSLENFALEGKKYQDFRTARNKLGKEGYHFDILSTDNFEKHVQQLSIISEQWLKEKNASEKSFSLGFFDKAYLARTRIATVKDPAGNILAFANLWEAPTSGEIAFDLMRYDPAAPKTTMDFLFAELMLWAKDHGYQWFNLGMVPLAGMESDDMAPLWHKIGTTIYEMGDEFYNFEGLYAYKNKFGPEWRSRYLAVPAGLGGPAALIRITSLISGGWRSLVKR